MPPSDVRPSPLPREPLTTAIHDGARFTALSAEIKAAIARGALFGLTSISILALLPLVARDQLGGGPIVYGVLMAGFGTGALCVGICNNVLRRSLSQERLTTLACIACAACCLSLALTSSVVVAAIALALGGAGWVVTWTGLDVSVQLASPRWVVGRTLSIHYALSSGGIAAGSWLWGLVAETYSLTLAPEVSAGALVMVAATGFLMPIRQWQDSDQDPFGFETPQLALDLKPRSGPIVVKIEYSIPEANVEAFPDRMQERRRVQSRVGAPLEPPARSSGPLALDRNLPHADLEAEDLIRERIVPGPVRPTSVGPIPCLRRPASCLADSLLSRRRQGCRAAVR